MKALASLKLTAVAIALLAAGVLGSHFAVAPATWAIAAPMALLALNLCAAIFLSSSFQRQPALLAFHIALAALAVLAAAGELMALKGRVELTTGEAFAGELLERRQGPLHLERLQRVAFVNEGFDIDYAPQLRRGQTRNTVRWRDERGVERRSVIGDHMPLVVHGYRFYTTPNKGFAPVFLWQAPGARPLRGSVHLPSFPAWQNVQAAEWTPPGSSRRLTFRLHMGEAMAAPGERWRMRLPATHRLEVEIDGVPQALAPGDTLEVGSARLRYEGLAMWMGYDVFSNWTLPWLLAAALTAAASLAWHFWRRFAARPWQEA